MAAHRDESRVGVDGKSSLVRDVDAVPRIGDVARRLMEDCVGIPASSRQQSFASVVNAMMEREMACRRKEESLGQRPEMRSLVPLEDALEAWNAKKSNDGSHANGTHNDNACNVTVTLNDVTLHLSDDSKTGKGASLSEAKEVMTRVMERCVKLTAAEKTLEEEGGFAVLPDVKIDGKNWAQWKAELKDAKLRYDLAKK